MVKVFSLLLLARRLSPTTTYRYNYTDRKPNVCDCKMSLLKAKNCTARLATAILMPTTSLIQTSFLVVTYEFHSMLGNEIFNLWDAMIKK